MKNKQQIEASRSEMAKSRAEVLTSLLGFAAGAMVLASCQPPKTKSTGRKQVTNVPPPVGGIDAETTCYQWNQLNRTKNESELPSALKPNLALWEGKTQHTLVISYPNYGHVGDSAISAIIIVDESNELLMFRTLTAADATARKSIIPIALRNSAFKEGMKVSIAMLTRDSKQFVFDLVEPLKFLKSFRNSQLIPAATTEFSGFFAKLALTPATTPEEIAEQYKQSLYTVGDDTKFAANAALKDCIIADMAGNVLAENGIDFTNILEYPEFMVLKLIDGVYYRTFVKLG
jgi:hypothetical protein